MKRPRRLAPLVGLGVAFAGEAAGRDEPPLFRARLEGNYVELGARRNTETRTFGAGEGADTRFEERLLTEKLHLGLGGYAYHPRFAQFHLGGDLTLAQEFMQEDQSFLPGGQGTVEFLPEHPVGLTVFGSVLQIQVDRTFARSYEVFSVGYGGVLHTRARSFPVDVSYTHRESTATDPAGADAGTWAGSSEADSRSDEYAVTGHYATAGGGSSGQVQAMRDDTVVHEQEIHRLGATANHTTTFRMTPHRSVTGYAAAQNQRDVTETTTLSTNAHLDWGWLSELSSQHTLGYSRTESSGQTIDGADAGSSLRHQLYESLTSTGDVRGHWESADYGTQRSVGGGVAEDYVKHLSTWGLLSLSAAPRVERSERLTAADSALAVDEPHGLDGPLPERLLNPDVDATTIRVTDDRGVPYREGVDYTVSVRGRYTELSRIATGDIPVGSRVLVDYRYRLPGATDVLVTSIRLGASVALLDAVTPYVRYTRAEPHRLDGDPGVQLDTVDDVVTGVRLGGPFFSADVQYERSRSQFNTFRAYLQSLTLFLPGTSKLTVSLNGTHGVFNYEEPDAGLRRISAGLLVVVPLADRLSLNSDLAYQRERWNREGSAASNALDAFGARSALMWQFRAIDVELGGRFSLISRPGADERQDLVYLRARRSF